jgi:hypothetical protein
VKKVGFLILSSLLLFSGAFAQRIIVVTNSNAFDRKAEMVEMKANTLSLDLDLKSYVLKNEKGEEVAYQLVYSGKENIQSLIFQANAKANSTSVYKLSEGKSAAVKQKTSARFVPERKDDFAWENDLAAYRMYGPALAYENPSNGVDLWLKCTGELIVDKFYSDELNIGHSYHVDYGQGLDCYAVGHTLGAGGIAPYASDSLWIGNHYNSYKVLENGPLRSVFTLTYDSVKVESEYYKQTITITANAGSLLNKAVVRYEGKKQKMNLAAGIILHDAKGSLYENVTKGIIAYAEDAVSSAKLPSGSSYVGVYIQAKLPEIIKKNNHVLILSNYTTGEDFTYYFGGGWSKWGYPTYGDWFKGLICFSESIKSPLKVNVK